MTKDDIISEMKTAMKSGDKVRLSTIRLLLSEVKYTEISKGDNLSDDEITGVIARELKKRREAIPQYIQGKRPDLAEKEETEARILQEFLPAQLAEAEVSRLVDQAVAETGAQTAKDIGKVMAAVMPRVKGRADGALVSRLAREKLSP